MNLSPAIFNIQPFSLEDGPGIRTCVFFKGCPMQCTWCHNPQSQNPLPESVDVSGQAVHYGEYYTVEELVTILLRDKPFYDSSGGGVTFTGGEPTLHMDYAASVAKALKENNIHLTLETAGHFDLDEFTIKLLPYIDLIYYDIKLINREKHLHYTGLDNQLILKNFEHLATRYPDKIIARTPLVPGITDTRENLSDIKEYLNKSGIKQHELLPYNSIHAQVENQNPKESKMNTYLSGNNFPADEKTTKDTEEALIKLLKTEGTGGMLKQLAAYQKILGDNNLRGSWDGIHEKLMLLFKCGKAVPLDGPMIGISMSIRDSDYLAFAAHLIGRKRSWVAGLEWMGTLWNATFKDTGIWMGKTFEPVEKNIVAKKTNNDPLMMQHFDPATTRIGRNYFRRPVSGGWFQKLGFVVINWFWKTLDRPVSITGKLFDSILTTENLKKEQSIPHSKTGGIFLANNGISVIKEMNGKAVYQLNYRWPALGPVYPMTRLVDELVQIDEGVYLGQLALATRHYSLAAFGVAIGEGYKPVHSAPLDYGYQNNGFFLMLDTAIADQAYAAFPAIKPV